MVHPPSKAATVSVSVWMPGAGPTAPDDEIGASNGVAPRTTLCAYVANPYRPSPGPAGANAPDWNNALVVSQTASAMIHCPTGGNAGGISNRFGVAPTACGPSLYGSIIRVGPTQWA